MAKLEMSGKKFFVQILDYKSVPLNVIIITIFFSFFGKNYFHAFNLFERKLNFLRLKIKFRFYCCLQKF